MNKTNMARGIKGVVFLTLLAASFAARAGFTTFDFTATVTSASGTYSAAAGHTMTGTFSFNLSPVAPGDLLTEGTVGAYTSSGWEVLIESGAYFGNSPTSAQLFTSTAAVNGTSISYATASPNPGYLQSGASGDNFGTAFFAGEETAAATYLNITGSESDSTLKLTSCGLYTCTGNAFGSNGLPIFLATSVGTGEFQVCTTLTSCGTMDYSITSMVPVPLPASAWLLLSGLIGVGAMARKRRVA